MHNGLQTGCVMLVDEDEAKLVLESITERQRAVLDLILEHRTSKEIARELGIAPNTVDQRLNAARDKLGARNRAETARIYSNLRQLCGETTCGSPVIESDRAFQQTEYREADLSPVFMLNDASVLGAGGWDRLEPASFPGARVPDSKLWRLGIIVAMAVGIAILVAAVLSMMNALNALV